MEDFLQQQLTIFLQLFPAAAAAVAVVSKQVLLGEIHAAGNAIVTSVREAGASAAGAASERRGGGKHKASLQHTDALQPDGVITING